MFITYGYKWYTKNITPVYYGFCPHCEKKVWIQLQKMNKRFTFCLIPLFSLGKKYVIGCKGCKSSWEIKPWDAKRYKVLGKKTRAFLAGELSREAYEKEKQTFGAEPELLLG